MGSGFLRMSRGVASWRAFHWASLALLLCMVVKERSWDDHDEGICADDDF